MMKISELGDKNWPIAYRKCLYDFKMKESAAIAKYYRPEKYINTTALSRSIGKEYLQL